MSITVSHHWLTTHVVRVQTRSKANYKPLHKQSRVARTNGWIKARIFIRPLQWQRDGWWVKSPVRPRTVRPGSARAEGCPRLPRSPDTRHCESHRGRTQRVPSGSLSLLGQGNVHFRWFPRSYIWHLSVWTRARGRGECARCSGPLDDECGR